MSSNHALLSLALRYAPELFPQLRNIPELQQFLDLAGPHAASAPVAVSSDEAAKAAAIQGIKRLRGGCILIVGARDTGKTTLASRMAEFLDRPSYIVSPSSINRYSYIQQIQLDQVLEIPGGSVLILDDIPTYAGSDQYHDALVKVLERLVPVCRHYDNEKGVLIIVVTQSSSLADKHLLDVDAVFLKPLSLLFADTERPAVKKLADKAMLHFSQMPQGQWKKWVYLVTHSYEGMIRVARPANIKVAQ